jgi:hypothetical protein
MALLQRFCASGGYIVLLEHLFDGAVLLARKLSINIGYEEFIAEFGHRSPLLGSGSTSHARAEMSLFAGDERVAQVCARSDPSTSAL